MLGNRHRSVDTTRHRLDADNARLTDILAGARVRHGLFWQGGVVARRGPFKKRAMNLSRRQLLCSSVGIAGHILLGPSLASETTASAPTASDRMRALGATIDASIASKSTPGVALTVWRDGREIYSRYAGLANLETGTLVSPQSVFRIASLTKQFTAALALRLASDGKLSLDDDVRKHLPFLAERAPFSIRELLQHTAGIRDGDYPTDGATTQVALAERIACMEPFFDFAPGTAWQYSNAGYILVGAVIEKVTGLALPEAAARLLFKPLSLVKTAFDDEADVVPGRVTGYTPTEKTEIPFRNAEYLDVSIAGAAGAIRSTATDLCRWHYLLFGGAYLPPAMVKSMLAPGRLRNGELAGNRRHNPQDAHMSATQYGLGFYLDRATVDGHPIAGHHGGINGFAAYLASHPSSKLTYACLCNADTNPGLPLRDARRGVFAGVLK